MPKWIRNSLVALGILGVVSAAPLVRVSGANDMQICVTIPQAHKQRAVDAFVHLYNYQETVQTETGATIPNPQTEGQFAVQQVREFVKGTIGRSEKRKKIDAVTVEEVDVQ